MQQYTPYAYPGTMPQMKKRNPFDISKLPPEMQAQLAAGQPIQIEDGSTIYPDGTAEGAGDSPDDFVGGGMGYDMGGYGGALTGAPPTAPDEMGPLGGKLFKRYRQTANAPFPGTPGGIGGGPLPGEGPNPMGEPAMDPFAPAQTSRSVTSTGGASINGSSVSAAPPTKPEYTQADDPMGKKPSYGGRFGRRQMSRQAKPGGAPMGSRQRR